MGCSHSSEPGASAAPSKGKPPAASKRRRNRRDDAPEDGTVTKNGSKVDLAVAPHPKSQEAALPLANPLATTTDDKPQRNNSMAPNNYKHIVEGPAKLPAAQPVVANAGGEVSRRPFRAVLREALELAKAQRSKYGKFRKDEKHAVMELYDVIGLEEDTFLGPPNELQQRLAKFTFPPPNMHMLREQEVDEDVVEYVLGAEEAKRRRQSGLEVAPAASRAANDGKRRVGVSSEATATLQKLKVFKEIPKTKLQTTHLMDAMQKSVLFKGLDSRDLKILFDAFERETFVANSTIFEKGDEGDRFYLVETGRCQIIIPDPDGGEPKSVFVGEGDTFGELGVMYGTPRAATVVSVLDSVVWWIDRDTYRGTLLNQTLRKRERYMKFMELVPILSTLDEYEKARIADVLEIQERPQGAVIVKEGDPGDQFFMVEEGEVSVTKEKDGEVARLGQGKFFGEVALLFDRPRAATVTVASAVCRLVSLSRTNFVSYLGPLEEKLRRNVDQYKHYLARTRQTGDEL